MKNSPYCYIETRKHLQSNLYHHWPVNSRARWWRCGDIWTDMPAQTARSTCRLQWSWSLIWLAVKCWNPICRLHWADWGRDNMGRGKKKSDRDFEINAVITRTSLSTGVTRKEAGLRNQPDTHTHTLLDIQAWLAVHEKVSAKSGMFHRTEQPPLVHSCNRTLNVQT